MSEAAVKKMINDLFAEMTGQIETIVRSSSSAEMATKRITEYVSSTVATNSLGYISALYSSLSKETLSEELFKSPENANKFYELGLRQKLMDGYEFDVESVSTYKAGVDFKEINRIYTSAGAAVGTAAVSGILLGVLSGTIHVPIVVIIAGAILAGLGVGTATYCKVVPEENRKKYTTSVLVLMEELNDSLLAWVDEVVKFYNQQIEELKKTL